MFIAKVRSVVLIAVAALALGVLSQSVGIVGGVSLTSDESFYTGQVQTALELGIVSSEAFSELAGNYDGSTEGNISMISEGRLWAHLYEVVSEFDAPKRFKQVQENLESSFSHLKTAGEYIEIGINNVDPDYLELGLIEINLATDDMEKATEELTELSE